MDVVDEPKHKLAEWARSIGTQVSREVPIFCEPLNFASLVQRKILDAQEQ